MVTGQFVADSSLHSEKIVTRLIYGEREKDFLGEKILDRNTARVYRKFQPMRKEKKEELTLLLCQNEFKSKTNIIVNI